MTNEAIKETGEPTATLILENVPVSKVAFMIRTMAAVGIDAYVGETEARMPHSTLEPHTNNEVAPYRRINQPEDWLGIEHFTSFQEQLCQDGVLLTRSAAISAFRTLVHRFPKGTPEYQLDTNRHATAALRNSNFTKINGCSGTPASPVCFSIQRGFSHY